MRKWVMGALVVVGLVLLAGAFYLRERRAAAALPQPMTWQELQAYYGELPDDQNAAHLYLEVMEMFEADDGLSEQHSVLMDEVKEVPANSPLPEELLERVQAVVATNDDALALLDAAAALPGARFPLNFSVGPEMDLPHLAALRRAARLRALALEVALAHGYHELAWQHYARTFALAQALEAEPVLVSQLVRMAICRIGSQMLARMLSLGVHIEPQQVAALHAGVDLRDALERALRGEIALMAAHALSQADRRVMAQSLQSVLEHRDAPWPVLLDQAESSFDVPRPTFFQILRGNAAIMSAIMLIPLGPSGEAFARTDAELRNGFAATLIAEAERRTAQLPAALDDLPPALRAQWPDDPFDGAPLRYAPRELGYVVYSVYVNRKDDGGITPEKGDRISNDWVFTVLR